MRIWNWVKRHKFWSFWMLLLVALFAVGGIADVIGYNGDLLGSAAELSGLLFIPSLIVWLIVRKGKKSKQEVSK
jgi:cobalamin synthase